MKPLEQNPRFSNPLVHATSPYLRQHAHNPVFWYPWGEEAFERARAENKPIHLSIGYSSCYWCHVMEREVFENISIASLMNRVCINIKVDREEHPEIDEMYMAPRQLMTHQGGWPNTLFLTPQLKPFYAGGTFAPDESYGKTPFPRVLEWVNYVWTHQEDEVRRIADQVTGDMTPLLRYAPPESPEKPDIETRAGQTFARLREFYDARSGGFFVQPKFPHESYLTFLLSYYQAGGSDEALSMLNFSLSKMAAGGIYDQVGCGFHRYAVDKEWYVPHFEKMLYNQAQLARIYTEAARLTGNPYFADIARGTLEFVAGPLTSGNGAFYSSFDAETDGIEGAYYAWSAEELGEILSQQEITFLTSLYALADIPHYPGHKQVQGQALILRKSLEEAARERHVSYVELAASCGQLMNRLLTARNKRQSPRLDDKVIVSWNGLMIDAFAHAGRVFGKPGYVARAREALDFLLENAIDNQGRLHHIYAGNRPQVPGMLEDYACLARGALSLYRAAPSKELLDAALSLMSSADERFADRSNGTLEGYFAAEAAPDLIVRIKNCDDTAMPGANAIMLHNLLDLYEFTQDAACLAQAEALVAFFAAGNSTMQLDQAGMTEAAIRWHMLTENKPWLATPDAYRNDTYALSSRRVPADVVKAGLSLFPGNAAPGQECELLISLEIKDGWHINAYGVKQGFLIPTRMDVQGATPLKLAAPEPLRRAGPGDDTVLVHEGLVTFTALVKLPEGEKRNKIKVHIRFQACGDGVCHEPQNMVLSL